MRPFCNCLRAFVISFFLCNPALQAQRATETLQQQFEEYTQNRPAEKLYVHTDKSVYVSGEVIWFKVYVTDARFHIPVDLSKVAYVEILDNSHVPVLQAKVSLQKGSGNGSFLLPASVNSGNFLLRAYTRWMRNSGPDFYFEKPVTIINTIRNFTPPPAPSAVKYDVGFFPEGGNLVDNLESRIGFKVTNQFGKGIDCRGAVLNTGNDTVVRFKTFHLGTGHFNFTPLPGETYKAVVIIPNDTTLVTPMPVTRDKGFVMHVGESAGQVTITINTDNKSGDQLAYLLSHTRQKINYAEEKTITGSKAVFTIDKKTLGEGISTFTVFNQLKQPVCERLYFKRPEAQRLSVQSDQETYRQRNKVTLNITADKEEVSDLSVSVFKLDSLQSPDQSDLLSYLWLSSDLKGYVENPQYYFNPGADQDQAADDLMLTQGWRRFKWDDVMTGNKPFFDFIPEYEGHIVTGKIINKLTGQPAKNMAAYLSAPAKRYQFTSSLSNADGVVQFNTRDLTGTEQIIVQTNNRLDSNYRVDIVNPFAEKYSGTQLPGLTVPVTLQNQLLYHSINSQVQATYLGDSVNRFYYPFVDTVHFFGPPEKVYYLDDYTRFTTMEEVLREYVIEVSPRRQNRRMHLYMLESPHEFFSQDPLVLVDGVPFFDMDSVLAIDPLKIKKIEVLSKRYFAGTLTTVGIVSYATYKGDLDGIRLDPNAVVMEYEGLQLQREFFSPAYETPAQKNSRAPDFRQLLYWSPNVTLNHQDKKAVSFYTSDLEGNYFIMVQGISASGKVYSQTAGFDVKK